MLPSENVEIGVMTTHTVTPRCRTLILAFCLTIFTLPAMAQGSDVNALVDQLERMRRDLTVLQRDYYRGEKPPPSGESDATATPRASIAQAEIRMNALENELRRLTGEVEQFDFRLRQINVRFDRLIGDVDFRLKELEQAVSGVPSGTLAAPSGETAPGAEATGAVSPGGGTTDAPLQSGASSPQTVTAPAILPAGSPMDRYNFAFSLLSKQNFADAEAAFMEFIAAHPDSRLAANAQYWLGETHYVRERYKEAAIAFNTGYQRYPDSSKASDTLLKLAITLRQLSENAEACAALSELSRRFPGTNPSVKAKVVSERKRAGCS